jgi:hypothetical protein
MNDLRGYRLFRWISGVAESVSFQAEKLALRTSPAVSISGRGSEIAAQIEFVRFNGRRSGQTTDAQTQSLRLNWRTVRLVRSGPVCAFEMRPILPIEMRACAFVSPLALSSFRI